MSGPSSFKHELVKAARGEAQSFGAFRRGDEPLEDRIEYYRTEVGIPATPQIIEHYSAVFISWCMRSAGASCEEFPAVAGHWQYAEFAADNAENRTGLFWARQIEAYAPEIGDVIHFNREGVDVDFDWVRYHRESYKGESGIVVSLEGNEAVVVIGNLEPAGNIGTQTFALAETGLVEQRKRDPFICVIEVGK